MPAGPSGTATMKPAAMPFRRISITAETVVSRKGRPDGAGRIAGNASAPA
jgi:hypothetical protein